MAMLKSILVPIDGSPGSLAALDHAVSLAVDYDAAIDVLHVVHPEDATSPDAWEEVGRAMNGAIDRAQAALDDQRLTRRVVTGEPLPTIVDLAQRDHYDLIVMGTHGRVGRLHSLLGSVAEGVVRNAPCPVLTVRDPSGGYQSFAERRHHRPSVADAEGEVH
ncbi:MAG: universal stress protein [Deltaproteobacteria bacterium]|nr:universal stress protein [Deltaproteobacteria bacterium]